MATDERTHLKWFQVDAQFEVFAENVHEAQHIFLNNHSAAILTAANFREKAV